MLVLFLFCTQLGFTQRQEQIDYKDMTRYLYQDFQFWSYYASAHIQQTTKPIVDVGLSADNWIENRCSKNQFVDRIATQVNTYDSNGNEVGMRKVIPDPSYIVFSDEKADEQKIGFAYKSWTGAQEHINHIFFVQIDDWKKINDQRRRLFLKLLSGLPKAPIADSILDVTVNGKNRRFFLFDLQKYKYVEESVDTSSESYKPVQLLFEGYDKELAPMYFSGKEKTYGIKQDQWGNESMQSMGVREQLVPVFDEDGQMRTEKVIPNTMQLKRVILFYEKKSASPQSGLIYPGAWVPAQTSTGIVLGYYAAYLSDQAKSRFSKTNQALLNYLIHINQ